MPAGELDDPLQDLLARGRAGDAGVDEGSDLAHLCLDKTPGGEGGRADADPRGDPRLLGIEGDHALADGDAHAVEAVAGLVAVHALLAQVEQEQVVVGAARDDPVAVASQLPGQLLGVLDDAPAVLPELRLHRLAEGDGLRRYHVLERAALVAGEDRPVDQLADLLVVTEDHPAARAAQSLVRRAGDHVRVRDRIGVEAGGDEAGDVGDVGEQVRAHLVGDLAEACEVDGAAVSAGAGDDQFGPVLPGELTHHVVIDGFGVTVDGVADDPVVLAGEVHGRTVRQVAAVRQVHSQHGVARLEQGAVDSQVGAGAGVRLHVRPLRAEQLLQPVDRQLLDLVDDLAAAVVALARVPLGVLVGEHAAGCGEHGGGDEVLGGDQFESVTLPLELLLEELEQLRVVVLNGGVALGEAHGGSIAAGPSRPHENGAEASTPPPQGLPALENRSRRDLLLAAVGHDVHDDRAVLVFGRAIQRVADLLEEAGDAAAPASGRDIRHILLAHHQLDVAGGDHVGDLVAAQVGQLVQAHLVDLAVTAPGAATPYRTRPVAAPLAVRGVGALPGGSPLVAVLDVRLVIQPGVAAKALLLAVAAELTRMVDAHDAHYRFQVHRHEVAHRVLGLRFVKRLVPLVRLRVQVVAPVVLLLVHLFLRNEAHEDAQAAALLLIGANAGHHHLAGDLAGA